MGITGFHHIDAKAGEAHWCVVISRGYQREGFAREALEACLEYCRTQLSWSARVRAVVARVPAKNLAMREFLASLSSSSSSSSSFKLVTDDATAPTFGSVAVGAGEKQEEDKEEDGEWLTYRCELR